MDSEWSIRSLEGCDGVALVMVDLHNPSPVDRSVCVRNRLDGPVLPPQRGGVAEAGWDDGGFTGVVPAGERRAIGYACPAPERRPPVDVIDEGRATGNREGSTDRTATIAVRELADPRPPADAVPIRTSCLKSDTERDGETTEHDVHPPESVETWLQSVERRIERGERLTEASVETATSVLDDGPPDIVELDARVSADAAALRVLADRTAALAERATAVDIPVEALRRLA
ncbi:hypothetical protein [Haloplanus halobius]|uniref:DUF7857 domain-containing protein n=1 Tax=Haloplanus halobius TaxID=2934938 RepID=UPI00200BF996|nr:hypothetical protein [Haloplanus sp. XH21]